MFVSKRNLKYKYTWKSAWRLKSLTIPIVLKFSNTIMLTALSCYSSRLSITWISNFIEAHHSTESFILWFPLIWIRTILKEGLEWTFWPIVGISCLRTACATYVSIVIWTVYVWWCFSLIYITVISSLFSFNQRSST